jgi:hypothetical protein
MSACSLSMSERTAALRWAAITRAFRLAGRVIGRFWLSSVARPHRRSLAARGTGACAMPAWRIRSLQPALPEKSRVSLEFCRCLKGAPTPARPPGIMAPRTETLRTIRRAKCRLFRVDYKSRSATVCSLLVGTSLDAQLKLTLKERCERSDGKLRLVAARGSLPRGATSGATRCWCYRDYSSMGYVQTDAHAGSTATRVCCLRLRQLGGRLRHVLLITAEARIGPP